MNTRLTTLFALTLATSTIGCAAGPVPLAAAPTMDTAAAESTASLDRSGSQMCTVVRRGARGGVKDARIAEHWPSKNYGAAVTSFAGNVSGGARHTLLAFELPEVPEGAIVTSAKIRLHKGVSGGHGLAAHQVTSAWKERTVTWNSFGAAYNKTAFAWLPAGTDEATSLDITPLAQAWADGSADNNGILLSQSNANTAISTSEVGDAAHRPTLEICWSQNI